MNLAKAIKVFATKYWKQLTIILAIFNLFLWYGNIIEFHIDWSIMAIVMIAFSLVMLTIWSIEWNVNEEFKRRKAEEHKSSGV